MNESLKTILDIVNDSLKFAESKNNSLLILINGVVIGLLTFYDKLFLNTPIYFVFLIFGFLLSSLLISLLTLYPRIVKISNLGKQSKNKNIFFPGSLCKMTVQEIANKIKSHDINFELTEFNIDFINQIIANSIITTAKYNYFKISIQLYIVSQILLAYITYKY
jgi:hypothetical protein